MADLQQSTVSHDRGHRWKWPPSPGPGVFTTIQSTAATRHLYPLTLGLWVARGRARRAWRKPELRDRALASMQLLLGETARAQEVDAVAREHLYESYRYEELIWRRGLTTALPVRHLQRLEDLVHAGSGVLVSLVHQSQFGAHAACLARHGLPLTVLVSPMLLGPQAATRRGLLRSQLLATFATGPNVSVLPAADSYPELASLLRAGGTVALGCDVKGSTPVRFLGRTVYVASGTARLAMETGAPIVPVSVLPHGRLERLELQEPLDPARYNSYQELLQALFARHEAAVLSWPQAMERPLQHLQEQPATGGVSGSVAREGNH